MSDPYVQHEQPQASGQIPYWQQAPVRLITPFNPRLGWSRATKSQKILALLSPLVPILCLLFFALPLSDAVALFFTVLVVAAGSFSYNALSGILRPLQEREIERRLRHFFIAAWFSFVTPIVTTYIYASLMDGSLSEDATAYAFVIFLVGYILGFLALSVLLLWSFIALLVRASSK